MDFDEKAKSIPEYDQLLSKMLEQDRDRLEYAKDMAKEIRMISRNCSRILMTSWTKIPLMTALPRLSTAPPALLLSTACPELPKAPRPLLTMSR